MTGSRPTGRFPWALLLAAAAFAAAARALLIGAKDGYAVMGLWGLASRSAARHFFEGLGPCVAVALLCGIWFRRGRGRAAVRFAVTACLALLAYLFISGRIPRLPLRVSGLHGVHAKAAQVGAVLAAVTAACMLPLGGRLGPIVARIVAGSAALLTAAAATALLAPMVRSDVAGPDGARPRPNVILISLDTVRADHLGCYGAPQPTTPEIDRFFSRDAIRFETAFAPQPWTLTSHMTMLTSLHPSVHGVIAGRSLPPGVPTLAEILRDDGYATFGYVYDVPWMEGHYGFDRGFHRYRRLSGSAASRKRVVDTLLDDLAGERFFLFLHYFDAHSDWGGLPYESDPADRTAFTSWYHGDFTGTDDRGRNGTDLLWDMNQEGRSVPDEVRRYVASLYDAGLRGLDRALGDLFRDLEARGLLTNTIVVLTADHGEEFEEHGKFLHTQAYDECVHVPLLFRVPAAGSVRVSDRLVGLVDVTPTLLDLCGIPIPPQMQGRTLRPLLAGEDDPSDRSHLLLMDEEGHLALRTERWKLITTASGRQLYDLAADPGERRDLAADAAMLPAVTGLLRMLEEEKRSAFALRAKVGIEDARGVSLSEAEIQQLKALGYLGGS